MDVALWCYEWIDGMHISGCSTLLYFCIYYISRSSGYQNIDDWHRTRNINIKEIIWLGNQLLRVGIWAHSLFPEIFYAAGIIGKFKAALNLCPVVQEVKTRGSLFSSAILYIWNTQKLFPLDTNLDTMGTKFGWMSDNKNTSSRKIRDRKLETLLKWCDHFGLFWSHWPTKSWPFDWSECHIWYHCMIVNIVKKIIMMINDMVSYLFQAPHNPLLSLN